MTRRRATRERREANAFRRWWRHRFGYVPSYVLLTKTQWRTEAYAAMKRFEATT